MAINRQEKIIFFLTLFLQVIFLILAKMANPDLFFEDDAKDYIGMALNIIHRGSFSTYVSPIADALRPPIYPLIIAVFFLIFRNLWAVIAVQTVVAAIVPVLGYRIAKMIFSQLQGNNAATAGKLAFAAGLMLIFESERLKIAALVMSETFMLLFFFLSILYLLKFILEHDKKLYCFLAGLFLGAAVLTKPLVQGYIALFIFLIILFFLKGKSAPKEKIKKIVLSALILAGSFAAVLAPWSVRNKIEIGTWNLSPMFLPTIWNFKIQARALYRLEKSGASAIEIRSYIGDDEDRLLKIIFQRRGEMANIFKGRSHAFFVSSFVPQRYLSRDIFDQFFKDPANFSLFFARQTALFFIDSAAASFWGGIFIPLSALPPKLFNPYIFWLGRLLWSAYCLIIIFGAIIFWKKIKKNLLIFAFLFFSIGYVAAIASFGATTRFRLTVNLFIFILTIYFLYTMLQSIKDRHSAHVTRGTGYLERYLSAKRARMADRLIDGSLRKEGRILDIGCGSAPFFLLQTDFAEKFGIDMECAAQHKDITIYNSNIEAGALSRFGDNFFDAVTMLAVIEHIRQEYAEKLTGRIFRILKPGGQLVITTPHRKTDKLLKFMAAIGLLSAEEISDHKQMYDLGRLKDLLIKSGFDSQNIRVGSCVLGLNLWITAKK